MTEISSRATKKDGNARLWPVRRKQDIGLIIYFFINGYQVWGALTLTFVALATLLMQMFSFHWHITDKTMTWKILLIHLLFLAPLHRYITVIKQGRKSRKTGDSEDLEAAYKEVNDICILRLFETFFEAAPQLVLQLFIIFTDSTKFGVLIGLSTCFSLLSVTWSLTAYSDSLYLAYKKFYKRTAMTVLSQTLWQIGMVTSRVFAIVLFATVFQSIVLVPLGVHVILMMIWITMIKPDFGATACERHLFTLVSAIIHTFIFINLKEGSSRWRMLVYYVIILVENSLLVLIWFVFKHRDAPVWLVPVAFSVVFGGFMFGGMVMLLYYGCCHPSGPAPIPARKPVFHKPPAFVDQSLKTKMPLFDETSRSERINLWLSASLDLSKEGLCENPTGDYPGYTSLHTPCNDGENGDHSYSQVIRTPADVHVSDQLMLGSGASPDSVMQSTGQPPLQALYLESFCQSPRSSMNNTRDRLDHSRNHAVQEYPSVMNNTGISQDRLNFRHSQQDNAIGSRTSQSRLDSSQFAQSHSTSECDNSQYRQEPDTSAMNNSRNNQNLLSSDGSMRDNMNLVEMFSRCKLDPSYVSNSSINESVFHISPVLSPGREQSMRGTILSSVNSETCDRTPVRSQGIEYLPKDISPLDPYKLWEESQNRMGQLFYQPSPDLCGGNKTNDSGMMTILPDYSQRHSHLSMSYTTLDKNELSSSSHESLRGKRSLTESVFYCKDQNVSGGSVYLNDSPLNKSREVTFSNMSLPLPDLSYEQNRSQRSWSQSDQGHTSGSSSSGYYGNTSDKSTLHRLKERNRSLDSYREENSTAEIHSSYSSDKGFSVSDRALTSGSDSCERSHRSFTSSGFQSEESNLSSSPTYANQQHAKIQFNSAPLLENEIMSIRRADHCGSESVTGPVNHDEDIYSQQDQTLDRSQIAVQNQMASKSSSPVLSPAEIEVLSLPPLLSRRSSSAGSSGSGRFFKDPTLSDDNENTNSSEESQYPASTDSSWRRSQFNEKSSLSAMISDMSSSKCGDDHSSDESLSVRSDRNRSSLIPSQITSVFNENRTDLVLNKTERLSYIADCNGNIRDPSQRDEISASAAPVYENIENIQFADASISSCPGDTRSNSLPSEALSNGSQQEKFENLGIPYNENPETKTARSNLNTHRVDQKEAYDPKQFVEDYDDSPQTLGRNVDLFNRDKWRASLDKQMRDRLVSDLEKLAPKKLYQLHSKNAKKNIPQMELTEYTESPYKFRKPSENISKTHRNSGIVLSQKFCSENDNEYENIQKVNTKNDYANASPNYLNQIPDYENVFNSQELLCPVAQPESLSDSLSYGRNSAESYGVDEHSAIYSPSSTGHVRAELYLESILDSINSRSEELSRTKSPINTTGINSAFRPVKSRSASSEDSLSTTDNNKTYTVPNTSYKEENSLSKSKELSKSRSDRSSNINRSVNKSKRRSNVSQHSYADGSNNSTFPWSGAEESSIASKSSNSFNYLNMVGYPLNFSTSNSLANDMSRNLTHSYSDSIPWEDSINKSISFQNNSNMSLPRSAARQPLKALENTPVFSPIYGQDKRQSIETSARTRFMSTPKLSPGEVSVLRNSSDNGSLLHSRYKSVNQSSGIFDKTNDENTSTWSTQGGSYGEHSSLSATTYTATPL